MWKWLNVVVPIVDVIVQEKRLVYQLFQLRLYQEIYSERGKSDGVLGGITTWLITVFTLLGSLTVIPLFW